MNIHRQRQLTLAIRVAAGLIAATPVLAQDQVIDLTQLGTVHPGFRMDGIDQQDLAGVSVSGAGDVNGDGLADLIVGARAADPGADLEAGESYVIFGSTDNSAVDLSNLGSRGFRIDGIDPDDFSGGSVSGAGDVNGDGLDDLIIGASLADPAGRGSAGEVYVVFGKADTTTVDLAGLGSGGFRIDGAVAGDTAGGSVSGAGDVNGDGLDDLIIGAEYADNTYGQSGTSFVVFGRATTSNIDLASLGTAGFRIEGINAIDRSGHSVSGAGDVNGDGLADVVIGANKAGGVLGGYGEVFVVFGKADSSTVALGSLGTGGFRIPGVVKFGNAGENVSGAGDVNGDGLADIIFGVPGTGGGQAYVIFGRTETTSIDLGDLQSAGFRIDPADTSGRLGEQVAGAGDVNGDGLADLVLGDRNRDYDAGEVFLVFGKADTDPVDLGSLGQGGIRIQGIDAGDRAGRSVSGGGDISGDGLSDLVVGAYNASPGGDTKAGEAYVVFSEETPPSSATYISRARAGDAPPLAIGVTGDGSNASSPDSRVWIDYADGPAVSTETATIRRNRVGLADKLASLATTTHWELSSNRTGVSQPVEVTVRYTDAEAMGLSEADLTLYRSSVSGGPYAQLVSTLDSARNTVSASTDSLGFFIVGEATGEIDVRRPNSIADGGTDAIGDRPIGSANLTYTVANDGPVPLTLPTSGNPTASNFQNVTNFFVQQGPLGEVAPASSTTFEISFDVVTNAAFSFDLALVSSDIDEDPYRITVSGNGIGGNPEIAVSREANNVPDGTVDDLGFVAPASQNISYTISSDGNVPLSVSTPVLGNGLNVSGLTIASAPASSVASGSQTSFDVSFQPVDVGPFSFDITINNNDPDENPYDISVEGAVPDVSLSAELAQPTLLVDNDSDGIPNPSDTIRNGVLLRSSGEPAAGQTVFEFTAPSGTTITNAARSSVVDGIKEIDDGTNLRFVFNDLDGGGVQFDDIVTFDLLVDNEIASEFLLLQGVFSYGEETILTDDPAVIGPEGPTVVPIGLLSRLTAEDPAGLFGDATGITEGFMAVAAPNANGGAGAVRIYRVLTDGRREFLREITVPPGFVGSSFGSSVAIQGNTLAVGSADPASSAKGATGNKVAIFNIGRDGSVDLVAQLSANLASGFGASLALDGDTLVVGAPEEDSDSVVGAGAVYTYSLSQVIAGGTIPTRRIIASTPQVQARFGASVACAAAKIVIGAPGPVSDVFAGSAAVYDAVTDQLSDLELPLESIGQFGASVATDGETIVVGSPEAPGGGGVFLYDRLGVRLSNKVTAGDTSAGDEFGRSVAIDGAELIVGAPNASTEGLAGIGPFGAVYRFASSGQMTELGKIGAFSESSGVFEQQEGFGKAVSAMNGALVIGAPQSQNDQGAAAFRRGGRGDLIFSDSFES